MADRIGLPESWWEGLWDPALGVFIGVPSGKTEVPQPVPEVAGPSQLLPVTVCVPKRNLVWLWKERWVLRGGEAPGPGAVLTDGLIMIKGCSSEVKEGDAVPWKERRGRKTARDMSLRGC